MKKVWLSILILVLIISALSISTSAVLYVEERDSRYIPKEILDKIGFQNVLVKAYDCSLLADFGESSNIEDVLLRCNIPERIVYFKRSADGLSAYRYLQNENGRYEMEGYSNNDNYASAVLHEFQTREVISTALPDAVIETVYFFYGSGYYEGNAIYYKTNLGDYVYYRGVWGSPQMLCTAERFFEYNRAGYIASRTGGTGDFLEWDLSAYDYRSPNFNPAAPLPNSNKEWLGMAMVILPLAVLVAVCVIVRRKRARESEEI